MTEYKLVVARTMGEMEGWVADYMSKAWKCQGGICYSKGNFYQAMVR